MISNSFLSFLQMSHILLFLYMLLFFFFQKMDTLHIIIWYWKSGFYLCEFSYCLVWDVVCLVILLNHFLKDHGLCHV